MNLHIMLFEGHAKIYESFKEMYVIDLHTPHNDVVSFLQNNQIAAMKLEDTIVYGAIGFEDELKVYGENYHEYILDRSETAMFLLRFK